MFNRSRPPHVIAQNAAVSGVLSFKGDLLVEGQVDGQLKPQSKCALTVAKGAQVRSEDLGFDTVDVFGTVSARSIQASRITLHAGSRVTGHLRANAVEIKEGAVFDGQVSIETKKVVAAVEDTGGSRAQGSASVARERLLHTTGTPVPIPAE